MPTWYLFSGACASRCARVEAVAEGTAGRKLWHQQNSSRLLGTPGEQRWKTHANALSENPQLNSIIQTHKHTFKTDW